MGAIVLNGAKVGSNCLIGAGALVPQNVEIPDEMCIRDSIHAVLLVLSRLMIVGQIDTGFRGYDIWVKSIQQPLRCV